MSVVHFRVIALVLILATVILSACQPSVSGPKIVASGAWGRSSAMMTTAGAVYVVIENQGNQSDRLIEVSSAAAKIVQVHESYMDNGMMSMRPVEGGLEIPAGGKVELKPGGYHIMLIDLVKSLEVGSKIVVTLKFEKSGEIALEAEIRAQ
jgi:copper(I)-binding protein